MAKRVLKQFNFSQIVFVPAYLPPHKKSEIEPIHRFNMLKLLEDDNIKVSDIEFKLPTPSFSYRTITELTKNKDKINFIIGFDAFKNIEKWVHPEILKEKVHFIVLKRTGENRLEIEKLKDKGFDFVIADNIEKVDVSSTEIREKINASIPIYDLLDEKVKRYINEHNLYKRN